MREASLESIADLGPFCRRNAQNIALGEPFFEPQRFESSMPLRHMSEGGVSLSQHPATERERCDRVLLLRNDTLEIGNETDVERHVDLHGAP